jgi:ribonuclease BN (tRNA processing enzyme)
MRLTVLGSSGSFPRQGSACSGYILEAGQTCVLMDCGNGTLSRLQQFHRIEEINGIVLSHLHFDHCGDMLLLRYAYETLLAFGKGAFLPIPLYLPRTPDAVVKLLRAEELFSLHFIEDGMQCSIGELHFQFQRMQHSVECYGMRVSEGKKSLAYSGDTTLHDGVMQLARNADVFLCEATTSGKHASPVPLPHLDGVQAGKCAAQAQVGRLLLTHSSFMEERQEILQCARQHFVASELVEEMKEYEV